MARRLVLRACAGQWCNTGGITGPASSGVSSPYPSRITVSGAGSLTTGLTVQLGGVTHAVPIDFDVLLVSPTGQSLVLMSDVGGNGAASNAMLRFITVTPLPVLMVGYGR